MNSRSSLSFLMYKIRMIIMGVGPVYMAVGKWRVHIKEFMGNHETYFHKGSKLFLNKD